MPISPATSSPRPPRDIRGGFTLMEMVLALAIIGLIAALGLPFSRPHAGSAAVRMKVLEIVAMLRENRNAALKSGRTTAVTIDPGSGMVLSGIATTKIHLPPTMALASSPGAASGFRFFPDGRSSGGQLSVSAGNSVFVVDVNNLTAAIAASEPGR